MNRHKQFFVIAIGTLLILGSVPKNTLSLTSYDLMQSTEKTLEITDLTDRTVIADILKLLKTYRDINGTWIMPAGNNDTRQFYGMVGLAGLGMKLLKASEKASNTLNSSEITQVISYAEEIADELISSASINNATHLLWSVHSNTSIIDLGYDFGLSGISSFFSNLFNVSKKQIYADYALKVLETINLLANHTNGLHWQSQIFDIINQTYWYPNHDFLAANLTSPSFLGQNFGSVGVGRAAIDFLNYVNSSSSLAGSLVQEVLNWLELHKQVNGSEISYPLASESPNAYSTSKASGIAGILKLFNDYRKINESAGLDDEIVGMLKWLAGSNIDFPRMSVTWFNAAGEIEDPIEFGLHFGVVGVLEVLLDIPESSQIHDAIDEELLNIYFVGKLDKGTSVYYERYFDGSLERPASYSYEFGSGGLIEVVNEYFQGNFTYLEGRAAQIKGSIYRYASVQNGTVHFLDPDYRQINYNPMVGFPSILEYISTDIAGRPFVQPSQLDFGLVKVGSKAYLELTLQNYGDGALSLDLVSSQSYFSSLEIDTSIPEWSIVTIPVSYAPTIEGKQSATLTVTSANQLFNTTSEFTIAVEGVGFTSPTILLLSPDNASTLSGMAEFQFQINDTAGLKSVKYQILDSGLQRAFRSGDLPKNGDIYSLMLDTRSLLNGSYVLEVIATDFLDYVSVVHVNFTVSNAPSSGFDDQTLRILTWVGGGLLAVSVIGAIYYTYRYTRGG